MTAWAFVIGLNKYPAEADVNDLHGAVADAVEFANWAIHPNGGGVPPRQLYFWTHPAPAADTSVVMPTPALEAVLKAPPDWQIVAPPSRIAGPPDFSRAPMFDEVKHTAWDIIRKNKSAKNSRIYVFFAGHGMEATSADNATRDQPCFMVGDFSAGPTAGLIPCDELKMGFRANGFSEVFMFLDCCRTPLAPNKPAPTLGFTKLNQVKRNFSLGLAALGGESAYEAPISQPQRGAFSQVLMSALNGIRHDGKLTLNRVEKHVYDELPSVLQSVNGERQIPHFDFIPRNPDYVLLTTPAVLTAPIVINFRPERIAAGGLLRVTDAALEPVLENIDPAKGPCRIEACIGTFYVVESGDKKDRYMFEHRGPGQTDVDF